MVDAVLDSLAERLAPTGLATKQAAVRAEIEEVRVKASKYKLQHTPKKREVVVLVEVISTRVSSGDGGSSETSALGPPTPGRSIPVPWALGQRDPVRTRVAKRAEVEISPEGLAP
jgi:hypothetical protein